MRCNRRLHDQFKRVAVLDRPLEVVGSESRDVSAFKRAGAPPAQRIDELAVPEEQDWALAVSGEQLQARGRLIDAAHELIEGLGAFAISLARVVLRPVVLDPLLALLRGGARAAGWRQVGELMDGPLFDTRLRKPTHGRLRRGARPFGR